jgi:hypothetical protein
MGQICIELGMCVFSVLSLQAAPFLCPSAMRRLRDFGPLVVLLLHDDLSCAIEVCVCVEALRESLKYDKLTLVLLHILDMCRGD